MWPSGRGLVPYSAAFQSFAAYNLGGNPDSQNQQGTLFPNPTTYPPYPPYWEQGPLRALYSQQTSRANSPQDLMAGGGMDQNWPFQNPYRRESVLEYKNGEVVMVKSNQQKWLCGTIQRMSAQGLWIWIVDANSLVNVPLDLVPNHVVKMSMYPELQAMLQPGASWTMAIAENNAFSTALVQCVCPAHLSNRQLLHKFGRIECAICKRIVSSIDMVSPWNCSHQVHNYCLQLRMQHSSTSVCPSCYEMRTSQHMPFSSTSNDSTLRFMPPTLTNVGLTSRLMTLPSTNNALVSLSNERRELRLDVQCACGFRGSIDSGCIDDMYAPVFCPNCRQPMNINPMTIGMQYGEPLASTYSEVSREILQRSGQDRAFGWPTQSFGAPNRLDATTGGSQNGIFSMPPPPDREDREREEPSFLPSSPVGFEGTSDNNTSDPDVAVDESMHPSSGARSSFQDGALTANSPTKVTKIHSRPSCLRRSPQPGLLPESSSQSPGQPKVRISLEDDISQKHATQVSARSSSQDASLYAPSSVRVTSTEDEEDSADDCVPSPTELLTSAGSTRVNRVKFSEVLEADKSPAERRQTETTTVEAPQRQILSRGVKERVDRTRKIFDEDSKESAEASTSNGYTALAPSTPPVYVNHFANFLKLAMASPSTAEVILESASASASSSITDHPLQMSPTPVVTPASARMMPATAINEPASAYFKEYPVVVIEPPADVSPARSFFSQGPALVTKPPDWVTNGGGASLAWISVIKDGVDSRRDDGKQWELDRVVKQKEAKFS